MEGVPQSIKLRKLNIRNNSRGKLTFNFIYV